MRGNGEDRDKWVDVRVELLAQIIRVQVTDEGPGFDPGSVPDPITPESLAGRRKMIADGGLAVLARHVESGDGAGGGLATPMAEGTIEVAGFGVRAKYRRRGLAAALTAYLTSAAHDRGAHTVFLTPAGVPEERIYAKVGFRPAGSFVNLRLE